MNNKIKKYAAIIFGTAFLLLFFALLFFNIYEHQRVLSSISWKSGEVLLTDSYTYGGRHNYRVEYVENDKTILLSNPERDLPTVIVNEADELVVKWLFYEGDYDDYEWGLHIFQSPESEPLTKGMIYQNEYDCSNPDLIIARLNSWYEDDAQSEVDMWEEFHKGALDKCNIEVVFEEGRYRMSF